MLNVVLLEPEIPSNTGNVARTCVVTGARLHLVRPYGFELSDRMLRRAGMNYWGSVHVTEYASWDDFLERALGARFLAEAGRPGAPGPQVHLLTKHGGRTYAESTYHDGDFLVFGKESTGIGRPILSQRPDLCERIPMLPDSASLADAPAWHARHEALRRDACGNFVAPEPSGAPGDAAAGQAPAISSLNLSNAVALVLYEALRQTGFPGMV